MMVDPHTAKKQIERLEESKELYLKKYHIKRHARDAYFNNMFVRNIDAKIDTLKNSLAGVMSSN